MAGTWAVVLIKDFDTAKQRLAAVLGPPERRRLARENAARALRSAKAAHHVLAVCGSLEAADLAASEGAEVLLEATPSGQNPAALAGIARATEMGATAVLLLSSDLPLLTRSTVAAMLHVATTQTPPAVVAAPATGRGGTNALYLTPPGVVALHFGDDSLAKFEREARAKGATFRLHRARALALDLDEPSDLEQLERAG